MSDQIVTHYVPYFTTSRWPTAACGQSARFQTLLHAVEPTCPRCQAWLASSDGEAAGRLSGEWAEADAETRERTVR